MKHPIIEKKGYQLQHSPNNRSIKKMAGIFIVIACSGGCKALAKSGNANVAFALPKLK